MFQIKVVEKIKIHISYSVNLFSENLAGYETMSKHEVEQERPQTI
jgi:hypothetical protein